MLCPEGNLAFYCEEGRDITVRGLTFDTIQPAFTQGEVVAMEGGGTLEEARIARETRNELDVLADQPPQHLVEARDDRVEVERPRLQDLLA